MLYEDCVSDVTHTSLSDSIDRVPDSAENVHVARGNEREKRAEKDHEAERQADSRFQGDPPFPGSAGIYEVEGEL